MAENPRCRPDNAEKPQAPYRFARNKLFKYIYTVRRGNKSAMALIGSSRVTEMLGKRLLSLGDPRSPG